jgi:CheY-like chemotaxis protein
MIGGMSDEGRAAGRVLVVDDSANFVELMAEELIGQGYEVETELSGEGCLKLAKSWGPDVILLDIQMPGMDGLQTCFALKSDPETEQIPVIFLTGHNAEEGSAMSAVAAGGSDFIAKPYSPAILFSRVAAHVAMSQRLQKISQHPLRDIATGLYSRDALEDILERERQRAARFGDGPELCLISASVKAKPGEWNHLEALEGLKAELEELVEPPGIIARIGASTLCALCYGLATKPDLGKLGSAATKSCSTPGALDPKAAVDEALRSVDHDL